MRDLLSTLSDEPRGGVGSRPERGSASSPASAHGALDSDAVRC